MISTAIALPFHALAAVLLIWKSFVLMNSPWFLVPNFPFYGFFFLFLGIILLHVVTFFPSILKDFRLDQLGSCFIYIAVYALRLKHA